ncbi:MAG: hypothetical protein WCO84_05275 [bacterium]
MLIIQHAPYVVPSEQEQKYEELKKLVEMNGVCDFQVLKRGLVNIFGKKRPISTKEADDMIIKIDRSIPFSPSVFVGEGWSIWRGHETGDGLVDDLVEVGTWSSNLFEFNPDKLKFKSYLGNRHKITGEERLRALVCSGEQGLDFKICQAMYEEPGQKTLRYLYRKTGVIWMEFVNQVLRSPDGYRYHLYLYRTDEEGDWGCTYLWLDAFRNKDNPIVVLDK